VWAAVGGLLLFCALANAAPPVTGSVTVAWDPSPGTNVIASYHVYWGVASRTYTNSVSPGPALTVAVTNLVRGPTYYFAGTATDVNGLESDFSTEVFTNIPVPPPPPTNLRIRLGP